MAHENETKSNISLTSEEQEKLSELLKHEDIVKLLKKTEDKK